MRPHDYVEFNEKGEVTRTGCLKCNDTIAQAKLRGDRLVLIPWSHYRAYAVVLSDGSNATLPVCADCYNKITPDDYPQLMRTVRFGWMKNQLIAYKCRPETRPYLINTGLRAKTISIARRA